LGKAIVDIFKDFKSQPDGNYDSVVTQYANLDIEWVVKNGNQIISDDTSWGNATADTRNLMVLVKGNLTVNAGKTLTAAARKRGMFIYVNGDLNLNGIISMTARGASATGQRLLLLEDGETAYEIPAVGGAGGASINNGNGNPGTSGVATNACGGGGSGGAMKTDGTSGKGGDGTSYSGGAASGGASAETSSNASDTGGAGTGGIGGGGPAWNTAGGGAGNPGGAASGSTNPTLVFPGEDGTGGLLVLYVKGTLTFGASGALTSLGKKGGNCAQGSDRRSGGGGSGGGHIDYFYGAISGTPTVTVTGGIGGVASGITYIAQGGAGGDGSYRATETILPGLAVSSNFFMFF